ncbi:MAG: hypothetical protein KDL87_18785, partial [Verrucomicrobiae bacterium]|nr:hypothetical protein [Verrucomicrobiae bacterium]
MTRRFPPAMLCTFLLIGSGWRAHAQEPFATDFTPTFEFEEHYVDHLQIVDDEVIETLENTVKINNARVSLAGVDIDSFNASTPYVIEMGDLTLSGVLGDDPAYTPGHQFASIDVIGTNWQTNAPEKVGELIFHWNESELTFTLVIEAYEEAETNTFSALAWYYWDYEEEDIEEEMDLYFQFGDRSLSDRIVYVTGMASYAEVESLEDYWDLSRVHVTGAIDATKPSVTITTPGLLEKVYTPTAAISGLATDNASGISEVRIQVNGGAWFRAQGFDSWAFPDAPLKLGRNTVRAMAIDDVGLESNIASRTFIYSKLPPLEVSVAGEGKVTKGFLGTTFR